jgi:hypothetical protein
MFFPVSSKGGGKAVGFPDVCKTPAPPAPFAPIPYPNAAEVRNADGTIAHVLVKNKEIVVESSTVPSSKGDQAGTMKGMVQPKCGDKMQYLKGSSKVMAGGKAVVLHLAPTSHNGKNLPAGGAQVAPSQTDVLGHV